MKPLFDPDKAAGFLHALGPPRVVVAIQPDGPTAAATPLTKSDLCDFLTCYSHKHWNLHFTVNRTRRPMTKKPTKTNMLWADFLHIELDPAGGVEDMAKWHRHTRAKIVAAPWGKPSFLWCSGNGEQALWRLSPSIRLANADVILEIERRNRGMIEHFADDEIKLEGTHNVDRLLRIPFTINHPNSVKRAAGRKVAGAGNVETF